MKGAAEKYGMVGLGLKYKKKKEQDKAEVMELLTWGRNKKKGSM